MADPGGYEGGRQASLLGLPDLPGRPIRRSGGGLCPAVLRRTEADGGVSTHPAPAVRCCLHPTAGCSPSVCSSPRAPSCSRVSGTQNFNKRAVSFPLGSQEGEDGSVRDLVSTLSRPLSLRQWAAGGPVRETRRLLPHPLPTMDQVSVHTTHSDPTSRRTAFRVGPLCSISLAPPWVRQ